jgi:hypothetical protein
MSKTYYPDPNVNSDLTFSGASFNKKFQRTAPSTASCSGTGFPGVPFAAFFTGAQEPYLTKITEGTYDFVINVTSNPGALLFNATLYVVDASGVVVATLGTTASQTGTGLKTFSFTVAETNILNSYRILCVLNIALFGGPASFAISSASSSLTTTLPEGHIVDSGIEDVPTVTTRQTIVNDTIGCSLPHDGIDELIVLVQVTGTPATGLIYTDKRILSKTYQRIEWDYYRTGGCGSFRLLLRESFPELDDAVSNGWEIHVRVRTQTNANEITRVQGTASLIVSDLTQSSFETWYRGVIRTVNYDQQASEQLIDIRGWGYIEQVNKVFVQKTYSAGLRVDDVVTDILEHYLTPYTRLIRPPSNFDVTNRGIDPSDYKIIGDLRFECTAFRALKFLAELQGGREWGVDAERRFYWRTTTNTVGTNFYLNRDGISAKSGGRSNSKTNQIKVEGEHCGGREHLTIRGDITDITLRGMFEVAIEQPWLTHTQDATRWADNIIADKKNQRDWQTISLQAVNKRIERSHPIPKVQYSESGDVTNILTSYAVCKIHYTKGGFTNRSEIREIGLARQQANLDTPVLRAEVCLGNPPRDLLEELEEIRDQVEALKSKWKQYRYPKDITAKFKLNDPYCPLPLDVSGKLPGELKHYRPVDITNYNLPYKDITNFDVTNDPVEIHDITNPRGVLLTWLDKQWMKIATRRTFNSLPTRGKYIGEIITKVTDLTNCQYGDLFVWTGRVWTKLVIGETGSIDVSVAAGGASVTSNEASAISAQAASAINVVSNAASIVSQTLSVETADRISADLVLSQAISVVSQAVSVLSQATSVADAALSVRIDTQSQSISVISQQVSALSQAHSVLSQTNSTEHAALSVRIDTQSQSISVISQQVSALSQVVSALSQANSADHVSINNAISIVSNALSNEISNRTSADLVLSAAISVISQQVSVLSQAHSVLSNTNSSEHAALSVRIDTQSQSISVISQQVSVLSQAVSVADAALSVRIDTQSQSISVISQQVSILSQKVSVLEKVSATSVGTSVAGLQSIINTLSNRISAVAGGSEAAANKVLRFERFI